LNSWKVSKIVRGNFTNGSAVVFRKNKGRIENGLEFEDGSQIWFEDYILHDFHEDLAVIFDKNYCGYIDRNGKIVIPLAYEIAEEFSDGHAFTSDLQNTFIIDKYANQFFLCDEVLLTTPFQSGISKVARVKEGGNYREEALVNTKGEFITPFEFKSIIMAPNDLLNVNDSFSEGLVRISDCEHYGFLDSKGNLVIPPMYDKVSKFNSGLAAAVYDDHAGFINKENEFVIDPIYEDAAFAYNDLLFVKKDYYWGIINKEGEEVSGFIFDQFGYIKNGMLPVCINRKWSLMSLEHDFITPPRFRFPPLYHEGIIHFILDYMCGVRDREGNELISYHFNNWSTVGLN
jgi:hypothetical protein